jgi:hypothetical protein
LLSTVTVSNRQIRMAGGRGELLKQLWQAEMDYFQADFFQCVNWARKCSGHETQVDFLFALLFWNKSSFKRCRTSQDKCVASFFNKNADTRKDFAIEFCLAYPDALRHKNKCATWILCIFLLGSLS